MNQQNARIVTVSTTTNFFSSFCFCIKMIFCITLVELIVIMMIVNAGVFEVRNECIFDASQYYIWGACLV